MSDQYPPRIRTAQQPGGQPNPTQPTSSAAAVRPPQYGPAPDRPERRTAALGTLVRDLVPQGRPPLLQEVRDVQRPCQPERVLVVVPRERDRRHRPLAVLFAIIFATVAPTRRAPRPACSRPSNSSSPLFVIPGILSCSGASRPSSRPSPSGAACTTRTSPAPSGSSVIPGVGGIVLLVLMLLESKPEGQRFDQPERGSARHRPRNDEAAAPPRGSGGFVVVRPRVVRARSPSGSDGADPHE